MQRCRAEVELLFEVHGNRLVVEEIVHSMKMANSQVKDKGYIQLAIRSGQYKTINAIEVYQGEIKRINRLTGEIEFNENEDEIDRNVVVGYIAYFKLINGFEKTIYMSKEEMERHAKKYSQSYSSKKDWVVKGSLWSTDFDSMAIKTILKKLISKYGIMSIEMQTAISNDKVQEDYVEDVEKEIEENANKTALDFVETEYTEVATDVDNKTVEGEPAF